MKTSYCKPFNTLLSIIVRATPPHERANSQWFAPATNQDQRRLAERTHAWIKAIAGDEPEQLDAILSACGRDHDALLRGFVDVVVADSQQLPSWASMLIELMSNDGPPVSSDLFASFTSYGRQALAQLNPVGNLIGEKAVEQMLEQLRSRLLTVTSQVLHYELLATASPWFGQQQHAAWTSLDGSTESWLRRFDRYPALAYVVAVTYLNWYASITELIERIQNDQGLLAAKLFDGVAPGQVVSFKGDAGDMHDHGRSVALLTFENNGRVVYKPKDLRVAAAYMDLVDLLNADLALPLATRAILTRGDYAWEEFVTAAECQSVAEVERFYRRMGMTIRLLQLLEARDFWLDNLIACGDQPVFIDLEMLLQPRDRIAEPQIAAERAAQYRLEESVVKMGIVAMPTVIGIGVSAEDLGALNSQQRFLTPFKAIGPQPSSQSQTSAAAAYRSWEHTEHVPHLDGIPMDSACYIDQVHSGYREMHAYLCANRERLGAADSPLLAMERFPVRFIHRDTWSCYQLIQWSLSPTRLVDGVRREQFLAQFLQLAYQQQGVSSQALQLAASEIAAVREGDVPFSQCLPCGRDVLAVDGGVIIDYFEETAAERLHARLVQIDSFDIDEQLDLLDTCFSTGPHQPSPRRSLEPRVSSQPRRSWLDLAVELGDFILAQASGSPKDGLAWLGRTYHPFSDMQLLELIHLDILTGSCGLAILFADLYAASGLARFRDAALGALRPTQHVIADAARTTRGLRQHSTSSSMLPSICGAFYGSGSQIYALRRCAHTLAMPALDETATRYLQVLPLDDLCRSAGHDVVTGTTGLLLATLASGSHQPISGMTTALADHLLRTRAKDGTLPSQPYPNDAQLAGLTDATGGLALASIRLVQRPAAEHLRDAAGQLATLVCEHDPKAEATARQLLTRLGLACAGYRNDTALFQATNRYLRTDPTQRTSAGLLDSLEIALAAFQTSQECCYSDIAEALGRELWQRRQRHGTWFPETFAADRHNLSVLTGIGAVAHAFLRLHNPNTSGSIRLVA